MILEMEEAKKQDLFRCGADLANCNLHDRENRPEGEFLQSIWRGQHCDVLLELFPADDAQPEAKTLNRSVLNCLTELFTSHM